MSNYSEEATNFIVHHYTQNPTKECVEELAEIYQRSTKSIIGKLAREGVYQRQSYKTKSGNDPVTKADLVADIVAYLNLDENLVTGLEKAPKQALKAILESIRTPS